MMNRDTIRGEDLGAQPDPASATSAPTPAAVKAPRSAVTAMLVRAVQAVVGIGAAVLLLGWVLPWITKTTWGEILDQIALIGWGKALWLLLLMLIALSFYTFTLVGSLPGLRHPPALVVNLIGSGVSDAMPGGGAVGMAAQYAVFRSWGFSHRNIGTSVIITTIWNLLLRALLPFGAIVWLVASGTENLPKQMIWGGYFAAGVAAIITSLTLAILVNDKGAHAVGRAADRVVMPLPVSYTHLDVYKRQDHRGVHDRLGHGGPGPLHGPGDPPGARRRYRHRPAPAALRLTGRR